MGTLSNRPNNAVHKVVPGVSLIIDRKANAFFASLTKGQKKAYAELSDLHSQETAMIHMSTIKHLKSGQTGNC